MSLTGFALANVGAFISFIPMLQILLPLKVMQIAPNTATATLGAVAAQGAVVAGLGNFAFGWLSDRSGRRPWIIAGLIGLILSYALIREAHSVPTIFVAFAIFQLTFNMMFAPLLALLADRVPTEQRGWAAALVALGNPVGMAVGTVVIGTLLTQEVDRYIALGAMVLVSIAPFAWALGNDPLLPIAPDSVPPAPQGRRWLPCNFVLGWLSRASVKIAFAVAQLYLLFYVETMLPHPRPHAAERGIALLAVIFGVCSAMSGIALGRLSDRQRRRKPIVIGAALTIAVGMMALAIAPSWPVAIAAYLLFAIGAGGYTAVEFALMVDILPSHDRAARDLGILNLSNIAPQIVAPLGITLLLAHRGMTIHWGFGAAAVAAAIGAVLVGFIQTVP